MGEVLKKFGRYFLLDHIAQGGMAEIFRARISDLESGGRLLVIKRIQSGYGSNSDFLKMFRAEIKVTMGFNHPNIVQVYDFGEEANQPFIAMEFVDGKTLRQFLARLTEQKQALPVELATYIILQVASGLAYAHSFKDKLNGQPLHIVHRDISPQNIIISYEGHVKIIDFGIAKATTSTSEMTRAGVIKGKPSYLSPEQISGETLEGRSDIFSLGIVFWELLAGRKLFAGENDLAVLKQIESCNSHVKPPSSQNAEVPKELDYIVLKMLAKQSDKRFQAAEELQRALHKFLYAKNPDFDPVDLSFFSKNLFKDEIVEDRKFLQRVNEKAEKLLGSGMADGPAPEGVLFSQTRHEDTTTNVPVGGKVTSLRNVDSHIEKPVRFEIEGAKTPGFPGGTRSVFIKADGPASKSIPKGVPLGRVPTSGPPLRAAQSQKTKKGGGRQALVAAALVAVTAYGLWQYGGPILSDPIGKRSPTSVTSPTGVSTQSPAPPPLRLDRNAILLKLSLVPWGKGAKVQLNGKALDPSRLDVPVEMNAPLSLTVEMEKFKPFSSDFTIRSDQAAGRNEWPLEVSLVPEQFGYLTLKSSPSADLFLNGERLDDRHTPIQEEKWPAGTYKIRLVNEVLGMEKTLDFTIEESKVVILDVRLELSPAAAPPK